MCRTGNAMNYRRNVSSLNPRRRANMSFSLVGPELCKDSIDDMAERSLLIYEKQTLETVTV